MVQENFYSGLPVQDPTQEAASMASFGKYDYDPATRMMQQQVINPGGYGFSANSPPMSGLGSPMRYDQYGNPMPTYNQFRTTFQNPALSMIPTYQQPMEDRPTTLVVPGINENGEYLPPIGIEDKISELQLEYWQKFQEQQAEETVKRRNTNLYGGYGFNYYGTPYYNPYQYNSLNSEVNREIEKIKEEARNARLDLNVKLSQLAHNYVHEYIDEEKSRERYQGRIIELPQQSNFTVREYQEMTRIDNMVEVNNAAWYQQQYAAASKAMNDNIPQDADLKTCFANVGIVASEWEMEDEMHRRKDYTNTYNSADGTYRYFVRKKAEERYAKEHGIDIQHMSQRFNPQQAQQQSLNAFPTLKDSVSLSPDGTLNVVCNVGDNAGKVYSVNEQEAGYQERKERFDRFLSSIPGSIYRTNYG